MDSPLWVAINKLHRARKNSCHPKVIEMLNNRVAVEAGKVNSVLLSTAHDSYIPNSTSELLESEKLMQPYFVSQHLTLV